MTSKSKVELGGAIIEQSLRDILDYEHYSAPSERVKALSYEKKSPTCFATRNDDFDIGCLEGAWEVLYGRAMAGEDFVGAFLEEVNGTPTTLKTGAEKALREELGYCPSKGLPLLVDISDEDEEEGEEDEREGGEGFTPSPPEASIALYNERLLNEASQMTLEGSLLWETCSHVEVPLTQAMLKKLRQRMVSTCYRAVSEDPKERARDSLLFAVAVTKPCNSTTQKSYNQYYFMLLPRKLYDMTSSSVMTKELEESLYGFLHVIGSAGKLWRAIKVSEGAPKGEGGEGPDDESADTQKEEETQDDEHESD